MNCWLIGFAVGLSVFPICALGLLGLGMLMRRPDATFQK